jgi:NAD(P)-dependent dehydrogenase (short-subunit alcohol dehydrogenase family)
MNTVLITGCSSGFGLETAQYFLARHWRVIATMRTPEEDLFPVSDRLRLLPLDVTDADSIARCVEAAGPIDVLVNNAGIGVLHPLEATSMEVAREVFETNTLGTIAMTQAVLPQFRQRRAGVVVNVTSTVTLRPLPLLAIYTASKAAVNAFTESLALELALFNVRATLVLPGGAPGTRFGQNAGPRMQGQVPEGYAALIQDVFSGMRDPSRPVTQAGDVAEAVWRAATDASVPMRLPAGADAVLWAKDAGLA